MSVTSVVSQITNQEITYIPTVVAGVQAAEALGPTATGAEKLNAVLQATSQQLAGSANPNVSAIAGLVNLTVLIANLLGAFKHAPKPV